MKPSEEQRQYVEDIALFFEEGGLSRGAGRIFGWLLICDPPHQTMNDLVEALNVSKSSVSTATQSLIQIGFVRRISVPGERRDYYHMVEGVWKNTMRARNQKIAEFRKLADRGLELLADQPVKQQERLQEMRDLYAFFEREFPLILERWADEQKGMK